MTSPAQPVVESVAPITEDEARAAFAELASTSDRLERLVRDDCDCYRRGRGWFHAATRESDLIPELGLVVSSQQQTLRTLIRTALDDEGPDQLVSALVAVIDFPFWHSLIEAGVSEDTAPNLVLTICQDLLARYSAVSQP